MPNPMIVHPLRGGRTPCALRGLPRDWPPGHTWSATWSAVTCTPCLESKLRIGPPAPMPRGDVDAGPPANAPICAWCERQWPGHEFSCEVYQRGGSGAIAPLSVADIEAVSYNLGMALMSLAAIGPTAAAAYILFLADAEARGEVVAEGVAIPELRALLEGLLPSMKAAIGLLKSAVGRPGPPEETPPAAGG